MEMYISSVKEIFSVPATQIMKLRLRAATVKEEEAAVQRRRALRRVDRELEKGNYKAALSLVKQLKTHPSGLLRGFGAAAPKVSRSVTSWDQLKLAGESKISSLQPVVDAILQSIKLSLEFQLQEEETEVSLRDFGETMNMESYSSISIDDDRLMSAQHEAGHFLVGYMLGLLPRRYKVPSLEDLLQDKFAQGKVEFIGFEFLRDVGTMSNKHPSKGKLNSERLKKISCVIVGGLAAEHLQFGYSELLHSDVLKLDRVLRWRDSTKNELVSMTRQAAEAAVLILYYHSEARSRLAEAMALGRSVGFCIEMIERTLNFNKL